jgi:hypothetical protein
VAYLFLVRRMRAPVLLGFVAAFGAFANLQAEDKPTDITTKRESAYPAHVGKLVSIRGRFSLRGKFGAFVDTGRIVVYILSPPADSFTWDPRTYDPLENHQVIVTGVLRFRAAPPFTGDESVARPPDFYYFELEHCSIRRLSR